MAESPNSESSVRRRPRLRPLGVVLAALSTIATAPASHREPPAVLDAAGNMVLGFPRATGLVEEYASVGCPHCAVWAAQTWPAVKARVIDTGRARFVLHEMLTGDGNLAAAGFLLARCAGPTRYFGVVDQVYQKQVDIERQGGPALLTIAEQAGGLTADQANACLADNAALKTMQERIGKDADARKVNGTPTFFVNGKRLEGEPTADAIVAALGPAPVPAHRPVRHRR